MNISTKIAFSSGALLCIGIGSFIIQRQNKLEQSIAQVVSLKDALQTQIDVQTQPQVVEKIVSNNQAWRPIQESVKDTVVQVFSQIAEIDLLQPYKSPSQHQAFGSGFFINENGDIITNAHVIDQAKSVWVQIPSLGKRIIDVEVISVAPERDLALVRVKPDDLKLIKKTLGKVPFLPLGDSDLIRRSDEVLALGYPLGQQSLKSTTGVISGREQHFIQMSAAINPGNSGGPLLNAKGEVIGINSAAITAAQNIGYIIPINDLKIVLDDFYKVKLLRKPYLGVLFNNATESLTHYLGNPDPGGTYVVEIVKGSTLDTAGVKSGDMIYEIDGHRLDIFGEMAVPWSEDKISMVDYVSRLSIGHNVQLVVYRNGKRKDINVKFNQATLPAVRKIYPGYESIDYEIFGGMVVMQLTINHIHLLINSASGLAKFAELKNQAKPTLVVTHIFPGSQLFKSRTLSVGATLNEINGMEVHTVDDFRKAVKKNNGSPFFTIRASDNVARATDNILISLPFQALVEEETRLALDFKYQPSQMAQELIKGHNANKAIMLAQQGTSAEQVAA